MSSSRISVSDYLIAFMERLGVSHVFGMPGAHILPVYDSLYASTLNTVLAKHEQGAAFMAGGHQRVSGGIGACIATAGPGATNLVTGVANAYAERQPLLVITGEAPTYLFGKGGLQESSGEGGSIDQVALFKGITRYARLIERTDYLPQVLKQAAQVLRGNQPGPVLLCLPFNVQQETLDAEVMAELPPVQAPIGPLRTPSDQIERLRELLLTAQRPVVVAGYGVLHAGAQGLLEELSRRLDLPVVTSLKGKGAIGEGAPLALGTLGVTSGGRAYDFIRHQADLVVFLGASFNERTSYLWDDLLLAGKRIIQVDLDPGQLGKTLSPELAIQADLQDLLSALLKCLPSDSATGLERPLPGPEDAQGYRLFPDGTELIEGFFQRLASQCPDARLFDDNMIFAQNFYAVPSTARYHPNAGVSSLGQAIPTAIGATFHEQRPTFALLGDGGFQMCGMELMTAVNYQRSLNVVLFNNSTMGLIRKNQHQHYGDRFIDCDFINPDFRLLAQSFGIHYWHPTQEAELDALFAEADFHQGINLIEIPLDRDLFPNYSSKR